MVEKQAARPYRSIRTRSGASFFVCFSDHSLGDPGNGRPGPMYKNMEAEEYFNYTSIQ